MLKRLRDALDVLLGRKVARDYMADIDTMGIEWPAPRREPYLRVTNNSMFGGGSYELYDGPMWTTTYGKRSPDNPAA